MTSVWDYVYGVSLCIYDLKRGMCAISNLKWRTPPRSKSTSGVSLIQISFFSSASHLIYLSTNCSDRFNPRSKYWSLLFFCLAFDLCSFVCSCEMVSTFDESNWNCHRLLDLSNNVGKILIDMSSSLYDVGRRKRSAGLLRVDCTHDLITPGCHGDYVKM